MIGDRRPYQCADTGFFDREPSENEQGDADDDQQQTVDGKCDSRDLNGAGQRRWRGNRMDIPAPYRLHDVRRGQRNAEGQKITWSRSERT